MVDRSCAQDGGGEEESTAAVVVEGVAAAANVIRRRGTTRRGGDDGCCAATRRRRTITARRQSPTSSVVAVQVMLLLLTTMFHEGGASSSSSSATDHKKTTMKTRSVPPGELEAWLRANDPMLLLRTKNDEEDDEEGRHLRGGSDSSSRNTATTRDLKDEGKRGERDTTVTFMAVADQPYSDMEKCLLPHELQRLSDNDDADEEEEETTSPPEFLIVLGDIKDGKQWNCTREFYEEVSSIYSHSTLPTYFILGDNEYLGCYDPEQSFELWSEYLLDFDNSHRRTVIPPGSALDQRHPQKHVFGNDGNDGSSGGGGGGGISLQTLRHPIRRELFSFYHPSGVLFLGLNMPNDPYPTIPEWPLIDEYNANWTIANFQSYKYYMSAVVIFGHSTSRDHYKFLDTLESLARQFPHVPILFLKDSHEFTYEEEMYNEPNLILMALDDSITPTKITVDPRKKTPLWNKFQYDRGCPCTTDHRNTTLIDYPRGSYCEKRCMYVDECRDLGLDMLTTNGAYTYEELQISRKEDREHDGPVRDTTTTTTTSTTTTVPATTTYDMGGDLVDALKETVDTNDNNDLVGSQGVFGDLMISDSSFLNGGGMAGDSSFLNGGGSDGDGQEDDTAASPTAAPTDMRPPPPPPTAAPTDMLPPPQEDTNAVGAVELLGVVPDDEDDTNDAISKNQLLNTPPAASAPAPAKAVEEEDDGIINQAPGTTSEQEDMLSQLGTGGISGASGSVKNTRVDDVPKEEENEDEDDEKDDEDKNIHEDATSPFSVTHEDESEDDEEIDLEDSVSLEDLEALISSLGLGTGTPQNDGQPSKASRAQTVSTTSATTATTATATTTVPPPPPTSTTPKPEEDEEGGPFVTTSSGMQYRIVTEGTGSIPQPSQTVKTHYTGWLDGFHGTEQFDSSRDRGQPFSFQLGQGKVIAGWEEALSSMKVGERWEIILPSSLGYGKSGAGGGIIPPDSILYFDVELLEVKDEDV